MNKNQKLRTKAIACLIVTCALIFLAVAALVCLPVTVKQEGSFIGTYLKEDIVGLAEFLKYPFKEGVVKSLSEPAVMRVFACAIAAYVVMALALAAIIVGIILSALRKKAKMIWYVIPVLVMTFISVLVLKDGEGLINGYVIGYCKGTAKLENACVAGTYIALAAVAFVMTVVTYFMGLHYAKHPTVAGEEELVEEAIPVLAEEAVADEMVEGNPELAEADVNDAMPEVEPEPEEMPVAAEGPVDEPAVVDYGDDDFADFEEDKVEEVKAEPEVKETDKKVEVTVNNNNTNPAPAAAAAGIDTNSLASLLREVVRDIVRDEIARNNVNQPQAPAAQQGSAQHITGATFGGPLVVQYFNGGINGVTPPAQGPVETKVVEAPAPAPAPAPVEEPAPAPAPVAEPAPAPVAPVVVPAPVEEKKEAVVYERISFAERLLESEKDLQDNYNEIKNEILSWGVKSRISATGDTFRLHKKMYVKITVAGKSLKLYFALDPADYEGSTIPVQDASKKAAYEEIPLVFKVKSGLSVRRCKELIQATMEKDGLEQGEVLKVNWIKELKAELKAGKKVEKKDDED